MAREFGVMPWDLPRMTRREYDLVVDALKSMVERSS